MICGNCNEPIGYETKTVARHLDGVCVGIGAKLCPQAIPLKLDLDLCISGEAYFERTLGDCDDDKYITRELLWEIISAYISQATLVNKYGQKFMVRSYCYTADDVMLDKPAKTKIQWSARTVA